MTLPVRRLPLLFFAIFVVLVILTEQFGQRVYLPLHYDSHLLVRLAYVIAIGIGLARCESWAWWVSLLLWPIQLLMISACVAIMIAGLAAEVAGDQRVHVIIEVALTSIQIGMLAAAFACLLLPSIRAAFRQTPSRRSWVNAACYAVLAVGAIGVVVRGAGTERAGALAAVVAHQLVAQPNARARGEIIWDGAVVELAAPAAAAYRVARHAFAAEAAFWQSLETLEAGVAGSIGRDQAARDAAAAVLIGRHEVGAARAALEDLEDLAFDAGLGQQDLQEIATSVERWAQVLEDAAGHAAETAPLITANEVAPGNATWGLVPTLFYLQETRAPALERLGRVIPQTTLERAMFRHFTAVSDALGDITQLMPRFVDRTGAAADLKATAELIWSRTIKRLEATHPSVLGLAASFREHENEIRQGIGVPLMAGAFSPVIANYWATGELALKPTNGFLSLRGRLLEATRANRGPELLIVPLLRSARIALTGVAEQAALSETRMGYFQDALGEAGT